MAKRAIFITRHDFPPVLYELLEEKFQVVRWDGRKRLSKSVLIENIKGKFGIVCYPPDIIDKEVIDAAGSDLKVVSTYSVGNEHLDVKELKFRGIKIGYTPDILTEATAEHAVSLLLATSRRILEGHQSVLKGEWTASIWTPLWMCGHGLHLSTVGIVGCGRIGTSVLEKLKSFKPSRILYYSRSEKTYANSLGAIHKSLDDVMKESDFIVVTLAQTAETKGIINKERIKSMKSNAIFVNVGRGGLVDEESLIEALRSKKIAGAGLDVFAKEPLPLDSPLLQLNNVVITPHLGSATYDCRTAMGELAAKNVLAVLNNEKMPAEL